MLAALDDAPGAEFTRGWFKQNAQAPSLKDRRLQQLWTSLTGDSVRDRDWWDGCCEHVVRCHWVVHRGAQMTRAEAQQSLDMTVRSREHVTAVTIGLGDP